MQRDRVVTGFVDVGAVDFGAAYTAGAMHADVSTLAGLGCFWEVG